MAETNVTLSVPLVPSADVTPFAIVWCAPKLMVDVVGLVIGTGPRDTKPAVVGSVMVRLPVIPMAVVGTLRVRSS